MSLSNLFGGVLAGLGQGYDEIQERKTKEKREDAKARRDMAIKILGDPDIPPSEKRVVLQDYYNSMGLKPGKAPQVDQALEQYVNGSAAGPPRPQGRTVTPPPAPEGMQEIGLPSEPRPLERRTVTPPPAGQVSVVAPPPPVEDAGMRIPSRAEFAREQGLRYDENDPDSEWNFKRQGYEAAYQQRVQQLYQFERQRKLEEQKATGEQQKRTAELQGLEAALAKLDLANLDTDGRIKATVRLKAQFPNAMTADIANMIATGGATDKPKPNFEQAQKVAALEERLGRKATAAEIAAELSKQEMTPYQQEMLALSKARLAEAKRAGQMMGLPAPILSRAESFARSFDSHPVVKQFNESMARFQGLKALVSGGWTGPSDMAIVFEFMRSLDPTSVVRESEYREAAKTGNIFSGWAARFNGALRPEGGFLSEQVRQDFLRALEAKVSITEGQVKNIYQDFGRRIDRITNQQGKGTDWLTDYTEMIPKDDSSAVPVVGGTFQGKRVLKVEKVK